MRFEWSRAKNESNIRKHGIDFSDVPSMFNHSMLTRLDERESYGEDRWTGIGWLQGQVAVVVYAETDQGSIRIISARKATRQEARRYGQQVKN